MHRFNKMKGTTNVLTRKCIERLIDWLFIHQTIYTALQYNKLHNSKYTIWDGRLPEEPKGYRAGHLEWINGLYYFNRWQRIDEKKRREEKRSRPSKETERK